MAAAHVSRFSTILSTVNLGRNLTVAKSGQTLARCTRMCGLPCRGMVGAAATHRHIRATYTATHLATSSVDRRPKARGRCPRDPATTAATSSHTSHTLTALNFLLCCRLLRALLLVLSRALYCSCIIVHASIRDTTLVDSHIPIPQTFFFRGTPRVFLHD